VPLIDVTCDPAVPHDLLRRLGVVLPKIVSEARDCPEDPWIGPPAPGDFDIRFRARGAFDVGELDCVIEVRTKLFASREQDKHRRAEQIREGLIALFGRYSFGVWLILAEGAWTQSDSDL
jgi:hypothetical protein